MKRGWLDYVIGMDFGQFFFATLLVPPGFWEIPSAFYFPLAGEFLQIVQRQKKTYTTPPCFSQTPAVGQSTTLSNSDHKFSIFK